MEEAKKLSETNRKDSEKQSLTNEINSCQKECDRVKETSQVLEKKFVPSVKEGKEKKDFDLVFKATAIKRKNVKIKNSR